MGTIFSIYAGQMSYALKRISSSSDEMTARFLKVRSKAVGIINDR